MFRLTFILTLLLLFASAGPLFAEAGGEVAATAWWIWPLALFGITFAIGILAVLGGVGGGVLFVPIISGFFPFHIDFVRASGLLVALCGALAAGPGLLKHRLASLRLAMPLALITSSFAIVGAWIGLGLPASIVQTALGITILCISGIMLRFKPGAQNGVREPDRLAAALQISGVYTEESTGESINWSVHRTPLSLFLFALIGFLAGLFGLGAGWANVPTLNLVMGAPLKVSVATSKFLLSITDTSAAWVYINRGCVIPMLVIPSLVGIMLGSFIGVRILKRSRPTFIRWMVISILAFAGAKALTRGLGLPFIF